MPSETARLKAGLQTSQLTGILFNRGSGKLLIDEVRGFFLNSKHTHSGQPPAG